MAWVAGLAGLAWVAWVVASQFNAIRSKLWTQRLITKRSLTPWTRLQSPLLSLVNFDFDFVVAFVSGSCLLSISTLRPKLLLSVAIHLRPWPPPSALS